VFLIALILPSLAVVGFGLKMMEQERELSENRAAAAQRQTISDVRRDMISLLDRIKTQEISANPDIDALPAAAEDPAVVLVGWVENDRLRLPWERNRDTAEFRRDIEEREFSSKIEAAETDPEQAIEIYSAALKGSHNANQKAYARFLLAVALEKSGLTEEAKRQDRELLALPSELVDDAGMPFAFYAAERLLRAGGAEQDIARRLKTDFSSIARKSPVQTYFLHSIFEKLPNPDAGTREKLQNRIATIEQAIALQQDLQSLQLAPAIWITYGREPWLVSVSPPRPENRKLVVAVRAKDIFGAVEAQHAGSEAGLRVISGKETGELLGDSLPGLRVAFAGRQFGFSQPGLSRFYVATLILVLGLTFVGGYLVWRDTQRELRMSDLRSQFVANVSHELKTPLTSIRMFAEALQIKGLADERKQGQYLDTIVNESERLTRLLNNVLDFSRIERGQKSYCMEPVSLAGVVDAAARTMKYPLARQGFELQLDVSGDIPPVRVDRDALEQAILNLLANAMKYSGNSREICLRLARQNGNAVIQVSDQGIGIPKAEQSRIFEKFYRVPSVENEAISGTGLGLALVFHIAAAHGGTAEVESVPGSGSTFSLILPLHEENGNDSK